MKKILICWLFFFLVAGTGVGASPFSEDSVEVKQAGRGEANQEVTGENNAEVNVSHDEMLRRPAPEDLEMEVAAFFKTMDVFSKDPQAMKSYLVAMENIEKELSAQLFNEIDYGVQTLYKRSLNGDPVDKLLVTKSWTQNYVELLDQVVLASAQFRKIALSADSGNQALPPEQISNPMPTNENAKPEQNADQNQIGQTNQADHQQSSSGSEEDTKKTKPVEKNGLVISKAGRRQMDAVVSYAMRNHRGASRGYCFNAVWGYLSSSGYGKIKAWGDLPGMQSGLARYFADYMNAGQANLNEAGLQRLDTAMKPAITNPHDSRIPRGAIIVVAAGSTGTSDPVAGDIVIKGDGRFINDGPDMWYGTSTTWRGKLLGVYVPK